MRQEQKSKQWDRTAPFVRSIFLTLFVVGAFCGIFFGFPIHRARAATATSTWTDGAHDNNWDTPGNWSAGAVPDNNTTVLFSASSTATTTINVNVSVAGITITSGYTGTIYDNVITEFDVGTSSYSQAGGTFIGSSTAGAPEFYDAGQFSLTGGSFTNPNGGLVVGGNALISSVLHTNSAPATLQTTSTITTSTTFYTLTIGGVSLNPYFTVATGTVVTVQSSTFFSPNYGFVYLEGGGQIDAQGSVIQAFHSGTGYGWDTIPATSTFDFILDGTGTQTISDGGYNGLEDASLFFLPGNFVISKSSGVVDLSGYLAFTGSFTNASGTTINPGTSTVIFWNNCPSSTITGSSTFGNILFNAGVTNTITIATGTTLTALDDFDPAAYVSNGDDTHANIMGGGAIDVQGNIEAQGLSYFSSSTVSIVMGGGGIQTIGDNYDCTAMYGPNCALWTVLPDLTINKTSGSVVLANAITSQSTFINANGTAINPGTSTVVLGDGDNGFEQNEDGTGILNYDVLYGTSTFTLTGSSTFYNLIISNWHSSVGNIIATIATGTTITVQGDFESANEDDYTELLGGGAIHVQGDILSGGCEWPLGGCNWLGGSSASVGDPSIVVDGTGTQIIGNESNGSSYLYLPNLTVQKSSGVAYGESIMTIYGSSTIAQGEFQLATGTSQSTFIQLYGSLTVNSGARLSDYPLASSTIELGAGLVNNGTVFFVGDGANCTLPLPNYIAIEDLDDATLQPWSGTGNFIMRYASVSYQTTSGGAVIADVNGTDEGTNSGSWTFPTSARPDLVQSVSASSTSASLLALPAFGFYPRAGDLMLVAVSARNQSILAPTDNASNTYTLVASTTIGGSPSDVVALYYAKSINTTSSFVVTANGSGGGPLSAAAFDYTDMNSSSTFQTDASNTDNTGTATALTSLYATGQSQNELYFGVMTLAASTTATSGSGWTPEAVLANNNTGQSLYVEDIATTSVLTTAAAWNSVTSTSYGAILGIFKSPYLNGYAASGTLDSATFDTRANSGAQLNSFVWQGSTPSNSAVDFQFAVSNSPNGPWNFEGPDGTSNSYFCGPAGTSIPLVSTNCAGGGNGGYALFSGYRYFRYQIILFSDSTYSYTPTVTNVTVNWSP